MLNGKAEHPARTGTANGTNERLVLHVRFGCGSLSITTSVSLLASELDVWASELGSSQSYFIIHKAMNGCKHQMVH